MDTRIISNIAGICGNAITIISLCCILIKPARNYIVNFITKYSSKDELSEKLDRLTELVEQNQQDNKKQWGELQLQSNAILSSLRSEILELYEKYRHADEITTFERENLIHLYNAYNELGGNSFVRVCMEELGIKIDE